MPFFSRTLLIVLDGAGCGALPDANAYGDDGSDTLGHVATRVPLRVPHLRTLGLARLVSALGPAHAAEGAYGRMAEVSAGKDSVSGHWEMMGLQLQVPFATYPEGFPASLIDDFERRIGRSTLGNVVASGTAIIAELGDEHMRTGRPIVYTSADSVFQVAAHEDVVPLRELYRICEIAFDLVQPLGIARVIARPFLGTSGRYERTTNRHDYAAPPCGNTLLDSLTRAGLPVTAIGKISDLFAGRGVGRSMPTASDEQGIACLLAAMDEQARGLVAVNLVDFDTLYGHRNDVEGYAANLERFDRSLGEVISRLRADDLLVITADHGNDPTTPGTDHSREYVPLLLAGARVRRGTDLGTRSTFADLGQTIADNFGVAPLASGVSFLEDIVVQHS